MKNVHQVLVGLLTGELTPTFNSNTGAIELVLNATFSLEVYLPEYARRPFAPGMVRKHAEHRKYTALRGEAIEMRYVPTANEGTPNFIMVRATGGKGEYVLPLLVDYHVHQAHMPSATFEILASDFHQTVVMQPTLLLVEKASAPFALEEHIKKYPWLHQEDWFGFSDDLLRQHVHNTLTPLTLDQVLFIEEALK